MPKTCNFFIFSQIFNGGDNGNVISLKKWRRQCPRINHDRKRRVRSLDDARKLKKERRELRHKDAMLSRGYFRWRFVCDTVREMWRRRNRRRRRDAHPLVRKTCKLNDATEDWRVESFGGYQAVVKAQHV